MRAQAPLASSQERRVVADPRALHEQLEATAVRWSLRVAWDTHALRSLEALRCFLLWRGAGTSWPGCFWSAELTSLSKTRWGIARVSASCRFASIFAERRRW